MESLVTTQWLADNLEAPDLVILDASHHLPAANRDALGEFKAGHIPGARFLDLKGLTDTSSPVPAALPSAEMLAARLAQVGVTAKSYIVLYDDSAIKTSARAWFILASHGFHQLAILDGGLAKWKKEGRPLQAGEQLYEQQSQITLSPRTRVATKAEMRSNCETGAEQVLDARSADRFFGTGVDPVHKGQNGRIPSSLNLPFNQVFRTDGTYKEPNELRAAFQSAGVQLDRPLVTTCGSGITAAVLLFAAHLAGKEDVRLYDGSWQEWEADPTTPKEQGPLREERA